MKPAYHISYRDEIAETQGRLFARLARENPTADGEDFISSYLSGELRGRIDFADAIPANMTAAEIKDYFVEKERYSFQEGAPIDSIPADWIGQFYSFYQWETGLSSKDIVKRIPVKTMIAAYPGLHDLDMSLAVKRISNLTNADR